jgi:hypothetical protein
MFEQAIRREQQAGGMLCLMSLFEHSDCFRFVHSFFGGAKEIPNSGQTGLSFWEQIQKAEMGGERRFRDSAMVLAYMLQPVERPPTSRLPWFGPVREVELKL